MSYDDKEIAVLEAFIAGFLHKSDVQNLARRLAEGVRSILDDGTAKVDGRLVKLVEVSGSAPQLYAIAEDPS